VLRESLMRPRYVDPAQRIRASKFQMSTLIASKSCNNLLSSQAPAAVSPMLLISLENLV
jgi:hypothetical protein